MEETSQRTYSEVFEILSLLEVDFYNKIPEKVLQFFKEERDLEYTPIIDINKSLEEQCLSNRTIAILAILNINYWCENEEEKQEFISNLKENDEYEKKLKYEKYNPDNLFKNKKKEFENDTQNVEMVVYKDKSIIKRILNKVKTLFIKNRED